ncbi:Baseplate J family protein [Burkholderia ambifaria MEX-5]|uniref:Baseplate J family protein n=1 Tax=Burkholderia ambifaria MEX-5 TaxID=396597 RepID=B1TCV6_9BURK|nr:Baseplate J family protein [Burkholderia ambifaria MEX-5]
MISPGDPDKGIDPVYEDDDNLHERIQLAPRGFSVAGPTDAYVFLARAADGRMKAATAYSPSPCVMIVTVLSREGDGTANEELLGIVRKAPEKKRPQADEVIVQSAKIVRYAIRATLRFPPYPPASRNGRATTRALRERGRAGGFFHRVWAGSAENSGIRGVCARKSLIVEKTPAPCRVEFAPIRAAFAPSPIFAPAAVAPFSSLSNSLKKKKKEYEVRQGIDPNATPRVMPVLPSIADAAYFLGPELGRPASQI